MGIVVRMLLLTTLLLASSTRALEDVEKGSCCESITLSSGGMGDFYQGERLGVFIRSGSSSSGRGIYTQSQGDNYLFFLSSENVWMVGPNVGQDFDGVLNRDTGAYPEGLVQDWEYYRDWTGSWEADWTMDVSCGTSGPTPDPDGEPCTWGHYCDDCNIWSEANGVRYCC